MLAPYEVVSYYSRRDIQRELVALAQSREVAIKFGDGGFGKRPDILQYENDVFELARRGATSFHASEERWSDPLLLRTALSRKQLDELRVGFDCIIDIDTKFLGFAKVATAIIIDVFNFYGIDTFGVKFSGNRGFHLCIPFESFPGQLNNQQINDLFPETPRAIAAYLKEVIRDRLREEILAANTLEEIQKATNLQMNELVKNGRLDPYSLIEIDNILISSRHMFRMPYSLNEKSGLASIPLRPDNIRNFAVSQAKIANVTTEIPFLNVPKEPEATSLLIQALDTFKKLPELKVEPTNKTPYKELEFKMPEQYFPPCIKDYCLKGLSSDGRKRAVFVLINFLKTLQYTYEEIEKILLEWNEKNYEKLKEGYILTQLSWHKKQSQKILPPNCSNEMYYKALGICHPDSLCAKIKNPVQYASRRYFLAQQAVKGTKSRRKSATPAK